MSECIHCGIETNGWGYCSKSKDSKHEMAIERNGEDFMSEWQPIETALDATTKTTGGRMTPDEKAKLIVVWLQNIVMFLVFSAIYSALILIIVKIWKMIL